MGILMVVKKRSFCVAFIVVVLVIFATNLSTIRAAAAENTKFIKSCNGNIGECLDKELEYLMDSDINVRLLQQAAGGKAPVTGPTTIKFKPVFANCDRGKYGGCIPDENKNVNRDCNTYDMCRS
uniref:Putative RALF n=1 Tax=Davidia involucrata TaxID=16924 RepID=A0A5B6Z531_DAVIN